VATLRGQQAHAQGCFELESRQDMVIL